MEEEGEAHQNDMEWRVLGVERVLNNKYKFKNLKLLEEALTHPSYANTTSYQRFEFLGDAVLGLVVSDYYFSKFQHLNEGDLTLLRKAITSNKNLARVALRHQLYSFVRSSVAYVPVLHQKVQEVAHAVMKEEEIETTDDDVKTHKSVLADIVETIVAAIYLDCGSDLKVLWEAVVDLLEPIVAPEYLPVLRFWEKCVEKGKQVCIKTWKDDDMNKCCIYINEELFADGFSDQNKNIAKINAAEEALRKFDLSKSSRDLAAFCLINELNENIADLQLHNLCAKMKWGKPYYSVVNKEGPAYDQKYTCSVEIEKENEKVTVPGKEKPTMKGAQKSAAFEMFRMLKLKDSN